MLLTRIPESSDFEEIGDSRGKVVHQRFFFSDFQNMATRFLKV